MKTGAVDSSLRMTLLAGLLTAPFIGACGADGADVDEASDTSMELAVWATEGSAVALSVAEPFEDELIRRPREELRDGALRDRIAEAVGSLEGRDRERCVSVEWAELTATVTFEQCVSPRSGHTIDGTITLVAAAAPSRAVELSFDALQVDACVASGRMALLSHGEESERTTDLTTDLTIDCGAGAFALELTGFTRRADAEGVEIDGAGTISQEGEAQSFSLDAVARERGDCLPSSGSVAYTNPQGIPVIVTFLEQTPETGVVLVKVGPLDAREEALFPACGSVSAG